MSKIAPELVKVAESQIGVEEVGRSNCGSEVNTYKAATWLPADKPWPWCAAFICWCVREAAINTGVAFTNTFKRPRTAGAWDLENWSLAQDRSTWTKVKPGRDIKPGDIIVYTFSHCGIAVTECDETGHFEAVEGNTDHAGSREGGGVFRKTRRSSQVRSRIRFRV